MPRKTLLFLFIFVLSASLTHAQSAEELRGQISEKNNSIQQLEAEIRAYQNQIDTLGKEANSLKNTLTSLDLSRKKLETNLALTQRKIENTNLEIARLSLQIDDKSSRIGDSRRAVSQSLVAISKTDTTSLFETFLSSETLTDIWNNAEELATLQTNVTSRIHELQTVKVSLESNKSATEKKKKELVSLKADLADQKQVIADTVKAKNVLLSETKNIESNYKKLLVTKQLQKEESEREMQALESSLRIAIDPTSLPSTGKGVLRWPVDMIKISQNFGITKFSPVIPHNGVDFAIPIGTPIKSSLNGFVVDAGNMDLANGGRCRSYGKWILVQHPNGLSTLYAHLSLIKVSKSQSVSTGEVIAYSGNTGNSTGPHLHFTVFASQGVSIRTLVNGVSCKNALLPAAPREAYLNPLLYLP